MKRKVNGFDVFVYLFCGLFAILCFYPLWYVFLGSISPYDSFSSAAVTLLPTGTPSFRYYEMVFSTSSFSHAFLVSIAKTFAGTAGMMVITSCLAYAVFKTHVKGMRFLNVYVIFTMYFGGTLIQYYLLYRDIGILDTFWVLTVPGVVSAWTFVMMRNYFVNSIPADLEQAATIDGANEAIVFLRIVVPISKPIFAAMTLFAAVGHWNDWTSYMYYCTDINLQPFVMLLQRLLTNPNLLSGQGVGEAGAEVMRKLPAPTALKYTVIMCAMLPIMCVYPFLQKYFAQGLLIGAVKE